MNDIKRFGQGEGVGFYWIQRRAQWNERPDLVLVAIDEFGNVDELPMRRPFDPAAPKKAEAVQEHLDHAITAADRELERRRERKKDEPPPPPPTYPDPATRRFYTSD